MRLGDGLKPWRDPAVPDQARARSRFDGSTGRGSLSSAGGRGGFRSVGTCVQSDS